SFGLISNGPVNGCQGVLAQADLPPQIGSLTVHLLAASSPLRPIQRLLSPPYASTRRSRRNGQLRRTSSSRRRSHGTTSSSSRSCVVRPSKRPKGSLTNDWPQKSNPPSAGPS